MRWCSWTRSSCERLRMPWSAATVGTARCRRRCTEFGRGGPSRAGWRWTCCGSDRPEPGPRRPRPFTRRGRHDAKPGILTTVSRNRPIPQEQPENHHAWREADKTYVAQSAPISELHLPDGEADQETREKEYSRVSNQDRIRGTTTRQQRPNGVGRMIHLEGKEYA